MAFKMKKFSGFGEGSGKETPMNFNAGLRKASKEGKLDNNPKFKAAVDNAPVKMTTGEYGKKHDRLRKKGLEAREKAMDAFDAGKTKKADRLDKKADKKLNKAREIRTRSN